MAVRALQRYQLDGFHTHTYRSLHWLPQSDPKSAKHRDFDSVTLKYKHFYFSDTQASQNFHKIGANKYGR